jgi:FtsP/CotA-like multicopper oxidase with cupredoxin domain
MAGAQFSPPPLLFSGMDGEHMLDDGTLLPFWGYGYVEDGFMTLPGPVLAYEAGGNYAVSFVNDSPEGHTIHLHGLDVNQSNDGVPSTSFTVMPDQEASYAFAANHPGTYLYHCHVTTTLHLTMGMYGMLLVTRPDGTLWEGGPAYDRDVPLLFSDLDRSVNEAPTAAYPFHTIRPDYFMVNGLSGASLTNSEVAAAVAGERVALRLASMAYAQITCRFPSAWNAEVAMSDGRPLPEAWSPDSLVLYPGERYTVLIEAPEETGTSMEVDYISMVTGAEESTQIVVLNTTLTAVEETPKRHELVAFPNPASDRVHTAMPAGHWSVFNALGALQASGVAAPGTWTVSVADWPSGIYTLRHETGATARFVVR